VAGSLIVAAEAGISVFATGGIGGVHRGAEQTFDISAARPAQNHKISC
jgi:pseudouridine-5'-phosphate glycosidase